MSTYVELSDVVVRSLAQSTTINELDTKVATAFGLIPDETQLKLGTVQFAADTGTANTYLVSLTHTPASYADGMVVNMRPKTTNTGASTINVNSLGVKSIKVLAGTDLSASDIIAGVPITLIYSSTTGYFHVVSNYASAAASALASKVAAAISAAAALVSENAAAASAASIAITVYAKTTSATLTTTEISGFNEITNDGAVAEVILTWPALTTGKKAIFYVNDAQYLQIKAPAGKKIRIGAIQTATAGYVRSNTVGNWIRIKALEDELVVVSSSGVWKYDE